ncbi:pitrilysin family protein [Asticcacaulis sp. EMRT-3]|uniref:M16 family metallopeptidase n=1 Tax=Asticcacaulis sp. EMRT-3 TaxID=3040349 RepID=UPI0024AECCA5|nr:pitrilysin family protein [Asticcacaulis sp. EMRT-3]MDI7774710.1 pitrilysin family protein [Asticcacaulis sp. EMRT-3]
MTIPLLEGQTLYQFDNGLRLLVDPMPGLKTFALNALVHGGARFESETQSGWAHLLEHMVFKGAGQRDARALAEAIEHKGGSINASTGYEHTRFEVRGLTSLLPLALEVVSDLMFRPVLDGSELEREKKVIEQEILEAYDTPDDHVFDLLQGAMFEGQALGRPILGSKASLKPARPESLRAFAETLYAPHRIVICVSGGITAQEVYEVARGLMEPVAPHKGFEAPDRLRFTPGRVIQTRRIEQANLTLAFDAIGRLDPDIIPLRLFSEILGGGMASRLFQEARESRGLAYAIDAWATPYRDGGVFGVYAGCAPGDVEPLEDLIRKVMAGLAADPLETELERAKAQFQTSLFLNHESAAARASAFASQLSIFDKVFSLDEVGGEIERIRRDDLARVGGQLAVQSQFASARLGPRAMTGKAA